MTEQTAQAETLAQNVERLELQTAKLDRLVSQLWKRVFTTVEQVQAQTPQEEACRLVVWSQPARHKRAAHWTEPLFQSRPDRPHSDAGPRAA